MDSASPCFPPSRCSLPSSPRSPFEPPLPPRTSGTPESHYPAGAPREGERRDAFGCVYKADLSLMETFARSSQPPHRITE